MQNAPNIGVSDNRKHLRHHPSQHRVSPGKGVDTSFKRHNVKHTINRGPRESLGNLIGNGFNESNHRALALYRSIGHALESSGSGHSHESSNGQHLSLPHDYDYTHMLRHHGEPHFSSFVQVNLCNSFLELAHGRFSDDSNVLHTTENIFIADETKLPVYIAAFGSGFFSTIVILCALLYIKFTLGKLKTFKRITSKRVEKQHLLSTKSLAIDKGENLAQSRARNPYLTRIENYIKGDKGATDGPGSAFKDVYGGSIVDNPKEGLDEVIRANADFANVFENYSNFADAISGVGKDSDADSESDSSGSEDDEESDDSGSDYSSEDEDSEEGSECSGSSDDEEEDEDGDTNETQGSLESEYTSDESSD